MSERYELDDADTPLQLVSAGAELGEEVIPAGSYALVIGNPWSSAFAVVGTAHQLDHFLARAREVLSRAGNVAAPR